MCVYFLQTVWVYPQSCILQSNHLMSPRFGPHTFLQRQKRYERNLLQKPTTFLREMILESNTWAGPPSFLILPSLKLAPNAPENRPSPQRFFRGKLLLVGSVTSLEWMTKAESSHSHWATTHRLIKLSIEFGEWVLFLKVFPGSSENIDGFAATSKTVTSFDVLEAGIISKILPDNKFEISWADGDETDKIHGVYFSWSRLEQFGFRFGLLVMVVVHHP